MTRAEPSARGGCPAALEILNPLPVALLDTPLDYILADHFRQRCLCGHLRRIGAERRATCHEADAIVRFLRTDVPLHHQDEEIDLFPAVRRRAQPVDDLEPILLRLSADHRQTASSLERTASALAATSERKIVPISRNRATALLDYAASEHRHLSIENGIVLVIARKRLTSADLRAMSNSMKSRRGVEA